MGVLGSRGNGKGKRKAVAGRGAGCCVEFASSGFLRQAQDRSFDFALHAPLRMTDLLLYGASFPV
jgi:hypothetical protein